MLLMDAQAWAEANWSQADLGDARLNRRVIAMAAAMVSQPEASLPAQFPDRSDLEGAYRFLSAKRLSLATIGGAAWKLTRQTASAPVVLMVQDTTELDYTQRPTMGGLGPIGDGRGRGLLLHTTLAVVPEAVPQVLGVAHQDVVLRQARPKPRPKYNDTPESRLWATAATATGRPPVGSRWVHVADRGGDQFRFMDACRQAGSDFLIRMYENRTLEWEEPDAPAPELRRAIAYLRAQPAQHHLLLAVPASQEGPARTAQMQVSWTPVTVPAPSQAPGALREAKPLSVWLVRTWEVEAPPEVKPLEWMLVTSVAVTTAAEALERITWYTHRWLIEDFHQCLKTGCAIEKRELDQGEDIARLLGICGPIAAGLLQGRQQARQAPTRPASEVVDRLTLKLLASQVRKLPPLETLTIGQFWEAVARLGGYQGRPSDGPPGWRTLWLGWRRLAPLVAGARWLAQMMASASP